MKLKLLYIGLFFPSFCLFAQITYSGNVYDAKTNTPLSGVVVRVLENNLLDTTDGSGHFSITVQNSHSKTITAELNNSINHMFFEAHEVKPQSGMTISLRPKVKSTATLRWENYIGNNGTAEDCNHYNSPKIPNDEHWNLNFKESTILGPLGNPNNAIRRDPSKVIKVENTYYVYYTKGAIAPSHWFNMDWGKYQPGITPTSAKAFTWDYCDVYYATSTDGYNWTEQGYAVKRGASGTYDDRSVFTPEVFEWNNKFYLVYQVVQDPYVFRVKNNVGMAIADSPSGPFIKLDSPILSPTNNGVWDPNKTDNTALVKGDFDSHKVHDPCLIPFKGKFYLYYKGERMGEEKFCGQREIKWGVAIADNPEGPYIKSEYNPITNTGHEVSVWPYKNGIAIIQHLDGPEKNTIQFAEDGVNFEIKGKTSNVGEALGIAAIHGPNGNHPGTGINWGLAHKYNWGTVKGASNFLHRFDLNINYDLQFDTNGYPTGSKDLNNKKNNFNQTTRLIPNPVNDTITINGFDSGLLKIYNSTGQLINEKTLKNDNKINVVDYAPGTYFIKVSNKQEKYTAKFIKE
ncbi:T9SS type A sorting domain-containing protein [Algibacter mikhailovii]|uniref:Secretion system C-terminal sorting domain-containing protein n=1 Tax=Algibacter mikhailovii TaxID=425498 RepID=A0A918VAF0_9FLAO|nr:T9SS type A sorting domain-containing protein [Algibacter mikhailovii]GGZ84980.1 hypothetical protein GCM10007028_23860 [Algibacter mikhailovii]